MAEETGGEKIHPASPQKRLRARGEGNIARSQDLSAGAALAAALLALWLLGPGAMRSLIAIARYYIGNAYELTMTFTPEQTLTARVAADLARVALPFALTMLAVGLLLNFAQVGFLFTAKPLQPKLDRLNPLTGMKRWFSLRTLVELAKSLAKLSVVLVIVWFTFRNRTEEVVALMGYPPAAQLAPIAALIAAVWWRIAIAMILIGLLDYAFQRWQHERDLRMTPQEVKQETKEMEGDPQIKRRVRQLQRQMAMQRMMAEVPKADVIITNPTHYAVALRYDMAQMSAPTVVAKGARIIAQRIRDLAVEHDVPIVQRPELARTLYRTIDVGQAIPENLFHAVAEVLSFVYRIDRREEKLKERKIA